jgi:ribosome-binding ATPase YchF (GTP1/OBG family)
MALEQVERGLAANSQTKLSLDRIHDICRRLARVLDNSDDGKWKALLREFGFKVVLQRDQPHVMRVSLNIGAHAVRCVAVAESEGTELISVSGQEEADISQLEPDEREEFLQGLGLKESSMERHLELPTETRADQLFHNWRG